LHLALARARDDSEVQGVILVGTGEAFSAGADLKALISRRPPLAQALERRELGALLILMDGYSKPLVAAVNGDALGAGFGLVAACQLAVAVEAARFGMPGVRLGIMPMTIMPALAAWVVIPFGPDAALSNLNAGLLLLMAITSVEVYGVIIAGWASNSKYASPKRRWRIVARKALTIRTTPNRLKPRSRNTRGSPLCAKFGTMRKRNGRVIRLQRMANTQEVISLFLF